VEFHLIEEPRQIVVIARGREIRELHLLRRRFGGTRWRKLKGLAMVELPSGRVRRAEVHWYECHGVGRRMMKLKRLVD
jgi:hypothetical protein